jgi:hypothetical protein
MTASVPKRVFPLESLDSAGGSIYVKLTGKGHNRSYWECVLAVDGPPLSHLQRRAESKMPFASHSGPLFLGDHR